MSQNRKLKSQVESTLKRIKEGTDEFEAIWDKVYDSSSQAQKEKNEEDLKKQIKKLQRYRDNLKVWTTSTDLTIVQFSSLIADAKKEIEDRMLKFRECEKETKTKAFSKEGLRQQNKQSPEDEKREEVANMIQKYLADLQKEVDDCEVEGKREKNKKKNSNKTTIVRIDGFLRTHRWHIDHLELVLRHVDNEILDPYDIDPILDAIEEYLSSYRDKGYLMDDSIYDELDLDVSVSNSDGDDNLSDELPIEQEKETVLLAKNSVSVNSTRSSIPSLSSIQTVKPKQSPSQIKSASSPPLDYSQVMSRNTKQGSVSPVIHPSTIQRTPSITATTVPPTVVVTTVAPVVVLPVTVKTMPVGVTRTVSVANKQISSPLPAKVSTTATQSKGPAVIQSKSVITPAAVKTVTPIPTPTPTQVSKGLSTVPTPSSSQTPVKPVVQSSVSTRVTTAPVRAVAPSLVKPGTHSVSTKQTTTPQAKVTVTPITTKQSSTKQTITQTIKQTVKQTVTPATKQTVKPKIREPKPSGPTFIPPTPNPSEMPIWSSSEVVDMLAYSHHTRKPFRRFNPLYFPSRPVSIPEFIPQIPREELRDWSVMRAMGDEELLYIFADAFDERQKFMATRILGERNWRFNRELKRWCRERERDRFEMYNYSTWSRQFDIGVKRDMFEKLPMFF